MLKKITSSIIAVVMIFSIVGFTTTRADAATDSKYVLLKDANHEYSSIKEKVGNYYFWTDTNKNTGAETLKCAKYLGVQAKILKTVKGSGKHFSSVVTNGNIVYYAIGDFSKATIYKTNTSGGKTTVVKTVNEFYDLAGCYNDKLYFTKSGSDAGEYPLYSINLTSKYTKLVKNTGFVEGAYGNNIVLNTRNGVCCYNLKSGKMISLPDGEQYTVNESKINIYYDYCVDSNGDYVEGVAIKQCDLNGKNLKELKLVEGIENYGLTHFGVKNAFFVNESNVVFTYNYASGTMTKYITKLNKTTLSSVKSNDHNAIMIKWEKVTNAKKYQVFRSTTKNGTYKLVKTVTGTSFKNTGLTTGKTYYYKVRAINGDVRGAYSAVKSAKPVLKTVNNVKAAAAVKSATITWDKVNGAKGYQVFRSVNKNGKYTKVKTVTGTKFTNSNLAKKTYYYKVRAYKPVNGKTQYGAFSKVVSCNVGSLDVIRTNMLKKINAERAKVGATPLKLYAAINNTAQTKAKDLYKTGNFSHYSKNLGYFYDQYKAAGITYSMGGENIAFGQSSVASVMNSWMNSKGHRENILNKNYTHVGIGYYNGYWVQQFITNPEGAYFKCPHCGEQVSKTEDLLYADGTAFWCNSCDRPIWKCLQCNNGYYKNVGIEKENQMNAGRCNNCGRNQYEEFVEFCQNCKTPIWDNYYQNNYAVSFRYPESDKPIMQEFCVSTFACKSCNQYVLASRGDCYAENYAKLKELVEPDQDIYDYIIWNEEIGWEDTDENTSQAIMGPDERWELEDLDDIVNMKYVK